MPSSESASRDATALPFVGREGELSDLERAIESEQGQVVLVVGPWQHGKTTLLRELHRRQQATLGSPRARFSLLYDLNRNDDSEAFLRALQNDLLKVKGLTWWCLVRGAPGTPDQIKALVGLPFSLLGRILNATEAAKAAKELAQSLVAGEHRLPREQFLLVLTAVARRLKGDQRLVLIFDPQEHLHESCGPDWVWLAERLPSRVVVIIAQRDDDHIATCDGAIAHPRVCRIPEDPLRVLSREASDQLVAYAANHPPSRLQALGPDGICALQRVCWERWRGHPLLLRLVLTGLPVGECGRQALLDAVAGMPAEFDGLMEMRWQKVIAGTTAGRDVLRCLCVLGAASPLDAVACVSGLATDDVRAAAEPGAYLPDLAGTLNNLGNLLSDLRERAQARKHLDEALRAYSRLSAAEPGTFVEFLARVTRNALRLAGEADIAVEDWAALRDAVALLKRLAGEAKPPS